MQQKIGPFLKELRKEKNLTQEELAEQLHVSNKTVSRWETGSRVPDLESLLQLADFYGVEAQELIEGKRAEKPQELSRETLNVIAQYSTEQDKKRKRRKEICTNAAAFAVILLVAACIWIGSFRKELKSMTVDNRYFNWELYLEYSMARLAGDAEMMAQVPEGAQPEMFSDCRVLLGQLEMMMNYCSTYQACLERYRLAWTQPKELRFMFGLDDPTFHFVEKLDVFSGRVKAGVFREENKDQLSKLAALLDELRERAKEADLPPMTPVRGMQKNLLFLKEQGDLLNELSELLGQR